MLDVELPEDDLEKIEICQSVTELYVKPCF